MVQLNPTQLRCFIRKSKSNSQVLSIVCKFLLIVVNGNMPVSIPNLKCFETAENRLTNPKTSLEQERVIILTVYFIRYML